MRRLLTKMIPADKKGIRIKIYNGHQILQDKSYCIEEPSIFDNYELNKVVSNGFNIEYTNHKKRRIVSDSDFLIEWINKFIPIYK
jgi:hypothetical protein